VGLRRDAFHAGVRCVVDHALDRAQLAVVVDAEFGHHQRRLTRSDETIAQAHRRHVPRQRRGPVTEGSEEVLRVGPPTAPGHRAPVTSG